MIIPSDLLSTFAHRSSLGESLIHGQACWLKWSVLVRKTPSLEVTGSSNGGCWLPPSASLCFKEKRKCFIADGNLLNCSLQNSYAFDKKSFPMMNFVLTFFVWLWSTYRLWSNNPFPCLRCVDWAPWVTARMPQLFRDVHCPSLTCFKVHTEKRALQWEMHFCNTEDCSCFLLPLGPLVSAALQGELAGSAPRVSASMAWQGWLPARGRLRPDLHNPVWVKRCQSACAQLTQAPGSLCGLSSLCFNTPLILLRCKIY